ncbi:NmrA family NAD(P)-binding protein [Bacteroidota bacterium]
MEKKILIIGAAGNICLEVIKTLSTKNVKIIVGVRDPEKACSMNLPEVEIRKFDYCDQQTYGQIFDGVDSWLLISPPSHLKIHNCVNDVIDIAIKAGIKQVVNISAFGIQDDSHPMRIIEKHIEDSNLGYTFLRPNCFMQYFNTYFRAGIVEENVIKVPAGDSKTSFVDLRNVAEAASNLLLKDSLENKTFILTGPRAFNCFEIAEIFTKLLNRKIEYMPISEDDYRLLLKLDGWLDHSIDASIKMCQFVRQGWNAVVTNGIYNTTGSDPTTFEKYVNDYKEFWIEQVTETEQ